MRISILPKTSLGKWSVALAVVFVVVLLLSMFVIHHEFNYITDPIGLTGTIASIILGMGALVMGLISIVKRRERAVLVFLAAIIGLFALVLDAFIILNVAFGYS
ncbi:MAG TPA: hypothetical protein VEG43_05155 [Dehalococcoidia bacterium]|nr:hypothetical protein [Dehalococcoidia bacterium]